MQFFCYYFNVKFNAALQKGRIMKKLAVIVTLLLLVLGVCACTPTEGSTPTPSPSEGIHLDTVYMKAGDTYRIYLYHIENQEDLETR